MLACKGARCVKCGTQHYSMCETVTYLLILEIPASQQWLDRVETLTKQHQWQASLQPTVGTTSTSQPAVSHPPVSRNQVTTEPTVIDTTLIHRQFHKWVNQSSANSAFSIPWLFSNDSDHLNENVFYCRTRNSF